MKKIGFILSIAIVAPTLFTSCKKNYDCTCAYSGFTNMVSPMNDYKKGDAEDACSDIETNFQTVDPTASCVLTAD